MVNCAVSCIKYIIFTFNFLCFLIGISLLGGSIYALVVHDASKIHVGDLTFFMPAAPYVIMAVGILLSVVSFLGCCGAIMESTCMLMSFSVIMLILLITQLGGGLYGLLNYDKLIENGLYETLKHTTDHNDLGKGWIALQKSEKCCGVTKPSDWEPILGDKLPPTCCPKYWSSESFQGECTIQEATTNGCKDKLVQFIKDYLIVWIALGFSVIILVQFIGVLFTCLMSYAYRKRDRDLLLVRDSLRYRSNNVQSVIHPTTTVHPTTK